MGLDQAGGGVSADSMASCRYPITDQHDNLAKSHSRSPEVQPGHSHWPSSSAWKKYKGTLGSRPATSHTPSPEPSEPLGSASARAPHFRLEKSAPEEGTLVSKVNLLMIGAGQEWVLLHDEPQRYDLFANQAAPRRRWKTARCCEGAAQARRGL